jgi:nucleotidyltransferase substrate binding protein (TIGR01987 family)
MLRDSLTNLTSAVTNLERALAIPKDRELVVEGTIHRFETTIELMWKTLKRALEYEGLHPKTPRESLREAFRAGWLHDEDVWLDMLDKRNTTSHVYLAEELAEDNYEDIRTVTPFLRQTLDFLIVRYADLPEEPTVAASRSAPRRRRRRSRSAG